MKSMRRIALLIALTALGLSGVSASASAATVWNLDMHHNQTHFAPGGQGEYTFSIANVGATSSSGEIRLTVALPSGIRRNSAGTNGFGIGWNCPGSPGDSIVICTANDSIVHHSIEREDPAAGGFSDLTITVDIAPAASGVRTATAKLEGGGAARFVTAGEPTQISATPAPFGIVRESFAPNFTEADGLTPEREAGNHPDLLTTPFDFNSILSPGPGQPNRTAPNEPVRNLVVDLPPGFIGAPTAIGECSAALLTAGQCPASSQIGRLDAIIIPPIGTPLLTTGVFNMVHPRGVASDLAFAVLGNPIHVRAFLDPARNYGITTEVRDINETAPVFNQNLTIWGVPGDPAHDSERCPSFSDPGGGGDISRECPAGIPVKPFITFPSECGVDHQVRIHSYDSWKDSGDFAPDIVATIPGQTRNCEKPIFDPSVKIVPTGKEAGTPTGIDVSIEVRQNESPVALATPPVKSTIVTFPEGMTVNPAFADGLDGCTLAEISLGTNDPVRCPDNSRIGEVHMTSSLLPRPLEGSMYLAKQGDNAFGSTFAMYLAVADTEERGVLVKVPGRIDLDPTTGQMTTSFDNLPQFPFDTFTLSFRSGQRAPLANPPTCGTHRIAVAVTSYAQPNEIVDESSTYEVNRGPNGSPCAASSASRPFDPKMKAGVLNPTAGSHSPFVFRLTREDTEQDISLVNTSLPPGMIAKLAGVATCPDSAIAAISTQEGTGQAEFDNPHCPANSLVGVLNAGVGAGTSPNYFGGKVYLAGPYKGAPLSLAAVVPAIAGPYDFGSVVVRIAADLDPRTTQVKAVSDPFPQLVHGILLHVRDIRLNLNRDQFTLNPTNCNPMSIDAEIFSDLGTLATPSSRFQVGECGSLGFKPNLALRLKGGTKRGAHPQLTATLTPRAGDANIASVSVAFPKSEFLENAHINTVCTRADFAASNCPAGAIYGRATAYTPLLDYPFEANVYLRSSSNLLPDVVPDFRGPEFQPIKFESAGRVDSVNGGIRNTFDFIPDAPITRVIFALQGGRKGLLVNSRDICRRVYRATVRYTAHNGARHTARPKMVASCGKAKKGKRGKAKRAHRKMG